MTLCIAAICTHNQQPAIVLCSDWRAETGDVAGGDVQDKLAWLVPKRWATLKAGPIADADKLARVFILMFQGLDSPLTESNIGLTFDLAMQKYRWMLIDHYLGARLGIDYAALVGGAKDQSGATVCFPEAFVEEKLREVEALPAPNCQLIIAGFINSTPVLCVVNEPTDNVSYARTRFETNFAAIGSGAPAALISLYRREHTAPDVPLMRAAYNVYEAKLVGEVSPGVGEATSITVLLPSGECWDLTTMGLEYLGRRFDYFGPLRYKRKRTTLEPPYFEFKAEFFEPYALPWESHTDSISNSGSDQT